MDQRPIQNIQNIENNYEAGHLQRELAAKNSDKLHAGYSDEPRARTAWWRFWRRDKQTAGAIDTHSTAVGSRAGVDPRRVVDFTRSVDEWIRLDAPAEERGAAFQALMERFADLPSDQRQAIAATALRGQSGSDETAQR